MRRSDGSPAANPGSVSEFDEYCAGHLCFGLDESDGRASTHSKADYEHDASTPPSNFHPKLQRTINGAVFFFVYGGVAVFVVLVYLIFSVCLPLAAWVRGLRRRYFR